MCFSPEASLASAGVLSVMGVGSIVRAARFDRSMLPLATFPLIFAGHQPCEYFVWNSIGDDGHTSIVKYIYIIIAFLVWPVAVPVAAYVAHNPKLTRPVKVLQGVFVGLGIALSTYLGIKLREAHGITVEVIGHHLDYVVNYDSKPSTFFEYAYATIVVVPLVTGSKGLRIFGLGIAISFALTYFAVYYAWFSVWCFFSALLSAMIILIIRRRDHFQSHQDVGAAA